MIETFKSFSISGEIASDGLAKTPAEDSVFYATLFRNLNGTLNARLLQTNRFKIMNLNVSLDGKRGILEVTPTSRGFWGVNGKGYCLVNFSEEIPNYRIQYTTDNFAIEKLTSRFSDNKIMTGNMNFSIDLAMQGRNFSNIRETLNGEVALQGKNLTVYGLDIDELLSKFEKSQRFNLVDMGAFFLAGPAGAAVTKSFDYAGVIISAQNPGERSNIPNLISFWEINNGVANANDVALITNRSRVALKGALNFNSNEYNNLAIAVVDKKGCTLLSQLMNGSFSNPEIEQITAVEAILAPVVNVLKFITLQNCRPFYSGSLKHPE
jgi:AsmA protein